MNENYVKLSSKIDNLSNRLDKLTGDSEKFKDFEKRVQNVLKIAEDLNRLKSGYLVTMQGVQEVSKSYELLQAITGLLLDNLNLEIKKEIDISEEKFNDNYKPLLKTKKGDYYYDVSTEKIELLEGLLNNWEVIKNENNIITWKNSESNKEITIPFNYDPNISQEDNFDLLKKSLKYKLRHPIDIVSA